MLNTTTHNVVGTETAIDIIETSVKTLLDNPALANQLPAILLKSSPGCGKSTIVKYVADKLGIGFVDVRLANMDRCDLTGVPSVENGETRWNVPSIWPKDKTSAGILFFDEITGAPMDVQIAAYSVILDRRIPNTDYELPAKWYIVSAGNLSTDRAGVKAMSSALANRFMHFDIEANVEDWTKWAVAHSIHPSVTGYLNYRPTNLLKMDGQNLEAGWPSPRSWERVSQMVAMFGSNEDVLRSVVYGLIGPNVGEEFIVFHRLQANFDSVLEVLTNPKKEVKIPTKADQKYAFYSAVSYLLWNGKNAKDDEKRVDGLYRILEASTADFATMLAKLAMVGNSRITKIQAVSLIIKHPKFKDFQKRFGAEMTKQYKLTK